jgi:hypothetical protein
VNSPTSGSKKKSQSGRLRLGSGVGHDKTYDLQSEMRANCGTRQLRYNYGREIAEASGESEGEMAVDSLFPLDFNAKFRLLSEEDSEK